ncbi:MAG: 4Fe-4S binding protein [Bacteroidetes bacterium]|nr:4Fe-4S binding protein [Bacteroidota bacterium]
MPTQAITDNRAFLVEKVIKNYSGIFDASTTERVAVIRRDKISRPVIYLGTGTSGSISGAKATLGKINSYLSEARFSADIIEVGCTGFCSAEPLLDIQLPGKTRLSFRNVTEDKVEDILNSVFHHTLPDDHILGQYKQDGLEEWPNIPMLEQISWFSLQRRHILKNAGIISPASIEDYIVRGGYKSLYKTVLNYPADKICEIIEQSELRGRGGGGYPTGKKWKVALDTAGDQKFMICNADESDPGAFMDRAVIESDPHRVIEGIAIAAYAIGASQAIIYVRTDYENSLKILEQAIGQAKDYGMIGEDIFGSGFNLSVSIRQGAGAFVCGEETALLSSLEGQRGLPRSKPPFPAEKGLWEHPTVINNVETLANVPGILENGPGWFKAVGTKSSKGTKLFSIAGKSVYTGFIEVPMGLTFSTIISQIAGGVKDGRALKAVQLGGPSGVCIPPADLETPLDYEALSDKGVNLGLGGLIILDDKTCMVNLARYFIEFLQNESCGKCIPCREGTSKMLDILEGITKRPKEESTHETLERFKGVVQLENLASVIRDTSLCGLGRNAPNPVLSSLKWFREEFEEHIFDRKCSAGVCHDLRSFYIDVDLCNGCNICQKKCPENAIVGSLKMPHFIIESKCTGCAICFDACKFSAIFFK